MAEWIDLVDPDETSVREAVPDDVLADVVRQLAHRPRSEDRLPRPKLEAHGSYVWGVFLAAAVERERDRVYYQEVDVVLTDDLVVTVRKTPPPAARRCSTRLASAPPARARRPSRA